MVRLRLLPLLLVALGGAGPVVAEEPAAPATGSSEGFIDSAHASISDQVASTARRLDAFFGDEVVDEERNASSLRFRPTLDWQEGDGSKVSLPVRVYLSLPNLEERWQAFISSESDEEEYASAFAFDQTTAEQADRANDDRHTQLGINYIDTSGDRRDLRYSLGARFHSGELDPYLSARLRMSEDIGSWQGRLLNKVYYFFTRGAEASIRGDLDRRVKQDALFRASSQVTWLEDEDGFRLVQALSYRRLLGERSAGAVGYVVRGQTWPNTHVESHTLFLEYRAQIWRDWLYYEVSPQLRFLQENDFSSTPAVVLSLDILFQSE